jgi:hypothetical protein
MSALPYIKGELDGGYIRFRLGRVLREEREEPGYFQITRLPARDNLGSRP